MKNLNLFLLLTFTSVFLFSACDSYTSDESDNESSYVSEKKEKNNDSQTLEEFRDARDQWEEKNGREWTMGDIYWD